jgi:hypothetical protein
MADHVHSVVKKLAPTIDPDDFGMFPEGERVDAPRP